MDKKSKIIIVVCIIVILFLLGFALEFGVIKTM